MCNTGPLINNPQMSSKPITHVVLFQMKQDTFDINEAARLMHIMKQSIPGVMSLEFGKHQAAPYEQYNDRSNGFTHALVSTHVDGAMLGVYAGHPDHLALVAYLKANSSAPPTAVDFYSHL